MIIEWKSITLLLDVLLDDLSPKNIDENDCRSRTESTLDRPVEFTDDVRLAFVEVDVEYRLRDDDCLEFSHVRNDENVLRSDRFTGKHFDEYGDNDVHPSSVKTNGQSDDRRHIVFRR